MLWMLRFLAAGAALMTPASSSNPITTAGERQFLPNSYPVENGVSTTLSVSTRANTWSAEASTVAPHQDTGEDEGRGRSLLHKVGCHGRRCFAACPRCTGDVGRGAHCKRNGKFFNCRRRLISSQFTEVGRANGFSGNISNLFPEVGNPPLQPQRKILQLPLPPAPGTRKGRFLHGDPAPTPSNLDTFKSANPSNSSNTTRQPQPVQDHAESPTSSTNTTPEHTLAPPVPASPPVRPPRGVEGKVEQPRGSLLSTTEFNEVRESIRQERQCPPPAPDPTLNCADPGIGEYLLSPNDPSYDPDCSRYITTICYDEQDDIYLHYLTQTSDVPSTILPDRVSAAASTPLAAAADPTSNAAADPPANATGQADSMKRGGIDGQGPVAIAPGDSMATPPEVRTSDQLLISMGMGAGTGNSVDVVETSGSAAEPAPSGAQLSQVGIRGRKRNPVAGRSRMRRERGS